MPGFLKQFCKDLRTDYTLNGWRDSFLFQYLKQERRSAAGRNQNDSYHRLEEAFAQTGGEEGRRAYLLLALGLLEKSRKPLLPAPAEGGPESGRALLLAYARKTGDPALSRIKRWDRKACRALLDVLSSDSRLLPPDAGLLCVLHRELTDSLLRREAEDYLYNLENGRKGSRDMAILEAYLDRYYGAAPGEGAREAGSGLNVYYEKSASGAGTGAWDGEKLAQLQRFYEELQSEGYDEALVPICMDPLTGAGLYFMGCSFLQGSGMDTGRACCIACLYLKDLDLTVENGRAVWSVWSGEEEELEALCGFPNVEEALKWFNYLVKGDGDPQMDLLSYFQYGNGYPPPGCPPGFLRYFLPPFTPQEDLDSLASEGQQAWAREKS